MVQWEVRGYLAQDFLQFERELGEYESVGDTALTVYADSLRDWLTDDHAPAVIDVVSLAVALLGEVQFCDSEGWFRLFEKVSPDSGYNIPTWQDLRPGVLCRSKGAAIVRQYEAVGIIVPIAMLLLFIQEQRAHFQIVGEEVGLEALEEEQHDAEGE
ncbi:MAG: hypothetical protein HY006_00770 [Candidatus Sungbacteria bacterium]|nr:hypothetical protein [Candidatus Sungbacteria bacterium]